MKYVCSWSGGKDSTGSIILAHENGEPLDVILFSEVMFDKKNNVSGENPQHMEFIYKTIPLFESWGYEVKILRADKDYLDCFYHVIEKPRKYVENKGKFFGFPLTGKCCVKRECKEKPIRQYLGSLKESYVQYVGICIDEPDRLDSLHKDSSRISLLEKYGYTQEMARALCEKYGLLSPTYSLSKRGGCWMCFNAKQAEHQAIKDCAPEAWSKFVSLENECNLAHTRWSLYSGSLAERGSNLL